MISNGVLRNWPVLALLHSTGHPLSLIDMISDTLSQGYTNLHPLAIPLVGVSLYLLMLLSCAGTFQKRMSG